VDDEQRNIAQKKNSGAGQKKAARPMPTHDDIVIELGAKSFYAQRSSKPFRSVDTRIDLVAVFLSRRDPFHSCLCTRYSRLLDFFAQDIAVGASSLRSRTCISTASLDVPTRQQRHHFQQSFDRDRLSMNASCSPSSFRSSNSRSA
jgi:hypothetical protein